MITKVNTNTAGIARTKAAAVGGPNPGGLASPQNTAPGVNKGETTPTAAAPTVPQVSPYLTAAENSSYTNAVGKDEAVINNAPGNRGTLQSNFDRQSGTNAARAATSFNNTNQSDAARGFGFSGIHDNAMADIQGNAVLNQNLYNYAYKTGLATLANNVYNAGIDIGRLGQEYTGTAAENATALATQNGTTANLATPYKLPSVTAPAVAPTTTTPPPVTYFNNPNMGAINTAIGVGNAAGTAAGV